MEKSPWIEPGLFLKEGQFTNIHSHREKRKKGKQTFVI